MSSRLVAAGRGADAAWPRSAGDASPYRLDEPYRQALRGMHARLASTAQRLIGRVPGIAPIGDAPALRVAVGAPRGSRRHRQCTALSTARMPWPTAADGAAWRGRDLRLPSRHGRSAPELGGPRAGRRRAAAHRRRVRRLPVARRGAAGRAADGGAGDRAAAAGRRHGGQRARRRASWPSCARRPATLHTFGANAIENYIISKCESVSDVLEVAVLFREVGLLRSTRDLGCADRAGNRDRAAVRDHRRSAGSVRRRRCAVVAPAVRRVARSSRTAAGGDARLLGQQQGRRLPDLELGAVSMPGGPGRRRPPARCAAAPVPRARRHRRPRRRVQLPRDHGAAVRQRAGGAAHDGAGRDDLGEVRRSRSVPARTSRRWSRRRSSRRCCARGRPITSIRASCASPTSCRRHRRPRTGSWCTRRPASPTGSEPSRRSSSCRR